MPKMTMSEDQLEVTLAGATDFKSALAHVKAVPGRRFDGDRKVWCLPKEPRVAERVMALLKPDVSVEVLSWIRSAKEEQALEVLTPLPDDAELQIPWASTLHPFQRAFVDFAADHPMLINADDMGLGKTFQALSAVAEFRIRNKIPTGPKLIVCPNSVKGVWAREIKKWLGSETKYVIVNAATPAKRSAQIKSGIEADAWIIVNWEQLRVKRDKRMVRYKKYGFDGKFSGWGEREKEIEVLKEPLFEETEWIAVIADEAHRAKNRKAQTTKGLLRINGKMKLALTGTPIQNTPDEIYTLLAWLFPDEYTSYWRFFDQYVDYYEGAFGKIITGVKNADALRFELSTRLKRRTKGQVLDLPEIVRQYVPVELGPKQRKLYKEAEKQMWFEVAQAAQDGDKSAQALLQAAAEGDMAKVYTVPNGAARIVRLRQVASTPALLGGEDDSAKLDAAVELVIDARPEPVVVFTQFVGTANLLTERLEAKGLKVRTFTGEVSAEDRTAIEDDFQNGIVDVVVGTIDAMKEGISLTRASVALFIERSWVPAVNEQAESRIHRQGQRDPVTIKILEAEDTVDDGNILPANILKSNIVSAVLSKDHVQEVRDAA